eukprot:2538548-Rhodomonas_salina.2
MAAVISQPPPRPARDATQTECFVNGPLPRALVKRSATFLSNGTGCCRLQSLLDCPLISPSVSARIPTLAGPHTYAVFLDRPVSAARIRFQLTTM